MKKGEKDKEETATANIEERARRKARRERIQDVVLASAYLTVVAGMAVMLPNALRLLKHVEKKVGPSPRLQNRISQAYSRLIARGLLMQTQTKNGLSIVVTEKGKRLGEALTITNALTLNRPKKWDRKWRVIIFDVWERRRGVRDRLRRALEGAEFVRIQNSVWVYPYPCEEFLVFLRKKLKLGHGILYMVVDELERDEHVRRHFKLPFE